MATLASNGSLEVEGWVKPSQVKDSQAVYLPGSSDFSRRVFTSWHRPAILKDRRSVRQTAQSRLPCWQHPNQGLCFSVSKGDKEVQVSLSPIYVTSRPPKSHVPVPCLSQ